MTGLGLKELEGKVKKGKDGIYRRKENSEKSHLPGPIIPFTLLSPTCMDLDSWAAEKRKLSISIHSTNMDQAPMV